MTNTSLEFAQQLRHEQRMADDPDYRAEFLEQSSKDMYEYALNHEGDFSDLLDGAQTISNHLSRALRSLQDAINGKEYARDAVLTALSEIEKDLKDVCERRVGL